MPINHEIWKVGEVPTVLSASALASERQLEDMIVACPSILSDDWMLLGRQVPTGYGGFVDLLAVAPDGTLVLIELKRDRTPREVVAQAIDYASWIERLSGDEISEIYRKFSRDAHANLSLDFTRRFGAQLDEDTLNESHQIVVVASSLDASTERIVRYLSDRDIAINVLYFQVFANGDEQLLSRAWMQDPQETQVKAVGSGVRAREPWNGEFYASFGEGDERSWDEAARHGFISAGGGAWYTNTLDLLKPEDRCWVRIPSTGFVGVGVCTGARVALRDFTVDGLPAAEVLSANYHRQHIDDDEKCEYFVPVRWLNTVRVSEAIHEVGMFGNQNTICKPRAGNWSETIKRLKTLWKNVPALQ